MTSNIYGVDIELNEERTKMMSDGWEIGRIQSMLMNIKKDDVVFDIGAEQGDITALLGKKAGGQVVAFEPSPIMWPHIRENLQNNDVKLLEYYCGFASDKVAENPNDLNYDDTEKDGFPTIAYEELDNTRGFRHLHEEAEATRQTTLDAFCSKHRLYPDVVTIDVEGSEWHVLNGMKEVINTSQPIIYVSVHDDLLYLNYGKWFRDIYLGTLKPLGYKCRFLGHDHESHFVFYKKSIIQIEEVI